MEGSSFPARAPPMRHFSGIVPLHRRVQKKNRRITATILLCKLTNN